jgi:uncharacterized protein
LEIRDTVHGAILLEDHELPVLNSKYFQRLRQIKQLGFAEYSFPSATHNRFIHSLGAMHTASQAYESIFGIKSSHPDKKNSSPIHLDRAPYDHFRVMVRLAAMLHDIGHGPLSHTTEFAMPSVKELNLPLPIKNSSQRATHEEYTLKIILDSELTSALENAGSEFEFTPLHIAALIDPEIETKDKRFWSNVNGEELDFRPILQQLISSEIDADRMDYLRRDSLATGVSYGNFDFDWLLGNLTYHIQDQKCFLALEHRALYAFEDFLLSRYHMFLMVYFHNKSVIYDSMLKKYFDSEDCTYSIPADIEGYLECTDYQLYSDLRKSKNPWAKRISEQRPYRLLMEIHSGMPASTEAFEKQKRIFSELEQNLTKENISHIKAMTTGELSKYFQRPGHPIFVLYDNQFSEAEFILLGDCTDLFKKYSEKRSITRLYVSPEEHAKRQGHASTLS